MKRAFIVARVGVPAAPAPSSVLSLKDVFRAWPLRHVLRLRSGRADRVGLIYPRRSNSEVLLVLANTDCAAWRARLFDWKSLSA